VVDLIFNEFAALCEIDACREGFQMLADIPSAAGAFASLRFGVDYELCHVAEYLTAIAKAEE
jgi:hypothetical protein